MDGLSLVNPRTFPDLERPGARLVGGRGRILHLFCTPPVACGSLSDCGLGPEGGWALAEGVCRMGHLKLTLKPSQNLRNISPTITLVNGIFARFWG